MGKRQQLLQKEIHYAEIEKLSHDGRGIARIDGKTTFIQGALPEEKVQFHYTRIKKDFDEGKVVSVLSASPFRVTPNCAHYDRCGGCSLQHLDEKKQLHEKNSFLLDLLKRVGDCEPDVELSPLTSQQWSYRNKARLSVKYLEKKQTVFVGFREKNNPRFLTALSQCPILNQKVEAELPHLEALVKSFDNPAMIAQIEVAASEDAVALIFRNLSPLSAHDEAQLIAFGERTQFRLFLQPKGLDSVAIFYPKIADSFLTYTLPKEDLTFHFHPTDFTQINTELNQKMVELVIELMALTMDDVVLDLFCGLGNFTLPFAKRCKKVIGVEGHDGMVKRAEMNASNNALKNTEFFCVDLNGAETLHSFASEGLTKIFLDPPRSGALEVVKQMKKLNPERIVYVSCNPATLARDAHILVHTQGYQLKAAGVMDMFPQTSHVESVALFERN